MKNLFLFCCVLISVSGFTQNLVPDPGFEITSEDCEPYPGLVHWYNPTFSTPDLYSYLITDCGTFLEADQSSQFQFPPVNNGNNMIGLFCCLPENSNSQSRDYLSTELSSPLTEGEYYSVSFKLHKTLLYNLAINRIGILFTNETASFLISDVIPETPQLESEIGILDTPEGWINLEWSYLAIGGESNLTIGCFRDFDEMNVVNTYSSWKNFEYAYYLVDEVQVEVDSSNEVLELNPIQSISRQGSVFTIQLKEATQIDLYSSVGQLQNSKYNIKGSTAFDFQTLSRGLYILKIHLESGAVITEKIIH